MKTPFFKPQIDEETIKDVINVIRSGWLTTGPKVAEFEKMYANYVGAKYAVMVNSGTAALHLCLAGKGLKSGDEVITTTYTFVATAEVIEYFSAKPVLIDIREDTMNIDVTKIESKITEKTRAIIPVHFAGIPCEMDTIIQIAKKYNLSVIEDAAHCTPAFYKGKSIGSISDATCFSFYANKCITTGEGGMITTDSGELAEKVKILRLHGMSKDAVNRYRKKGNWKYDIALRGYKYNPTDISAAIGIGQLKKANIFWRERKRVIKYYQMLLKNNENIQLLEVPAQIKPSWHIFPIRLKGTLWKKRDTIIEKLRTKGISTSVHFIPLHMHSYFRKKYHYKPKDFQSAYDSFKRTITLPVYPSLQNNEIDYIVKNITLAIKNNV